MRRSGGECRSRSAGLSEEVHEANLRVHRLLVQHRHETLSNRCALQLGAGPQFQWVVYFSLRYILHFTFSSNLLCGSTQEVSLGTLKIKITSHAILVPYKSWGR